MYSTYCKKKKELARQVFVHYSSYECSNLAQVIQSFKKFIVFREYLKKGILGTFKFFVSTIYLLMKKGFCALFLTSTRWLVVVNILSMHDKLYMKKWIV